MTAPDDPQDIFDHIVNGKHTNADLEVLRQLLTVNSNQNVVQIGKYAINIGQGNDICIGDRTIYQGADAETIRKIIREEIKAITDARYIPESHTIASSNSIATLDTEVIPLQSSPPTTSTFEFEVITVDDRGQETKRYFKQAQYFVEFLDDAVELAMVSIPGGKFTMGSLQEEPGSC